MAWMYIQQRREWTEAILGMETKNEYVISENGRIIAEAYESSSWLERIVFRRFRSFQMVVEHSPGRVMMHLYRPFSFFLHRLEIHDSSGQYLGAVQRKLAFFARDYIIEDEAHRTVFQISSAPLSPWTFDLFLDGRVVGTIRKRWGGMIQEGLTDADNFFVEYPGSWEDKIRRLLMAAVLLIDFAHFEY